MLQTFLGLSFFFYSTYTEERKYLLATFASGGGGLHQQSEEAKLFMTLNSKPAKFDTETICTFSTVGIPNHWYLSRGVVYSCGLLEVPVRVSFSSTSSYSTRCSNCLWHGIIQEISLCDHNGPFYL